MNYYPFHIGDYASATRHLSWEEDLAYRRLLDAYYTREEPIPSDQRTSWRLVVATTPEQRAAVDSVLAEFFTLTDRGYQHARCDAEIEAAQRKKVKAAQSASARWRNAKVDDLEMRTQCERNANASDNECERIETVCVGNAPNPNPNPNPKEIKERQRVARAVFPKKPESVPDDVWNDFVALRKTKRAPLTETAVRGIEAEATKAGVSMSAALQMCCSRGWQGFKAEWVSGAPPGRANGESYRERDERIAREKWEKATGRSHPENAASNVIDITPQAMPAILEMQNEPPAALG